jgi:hypothetical protein
MTLRGAPVAALLAVVIGGCGSATAPGDGVATEVSPAPTLASLETPPAAQASGSTSVAGPETTIEDGTGTAVGSLTDCPVHSEDSWTSEPEPLADYVDAVTVGGRQFVSNPPVENPPLESFLGELVTTVCFTLNAVTVGENFAHKDRDATFLAVGTPLHAIRGSDPRLRLTARTDMGLRLYEVNFVEGATTGAEVIDTDSAITAIGINSDSDGTTRLATISDEVHVRQLVEALAAAPVRSGAYVGDGARYFVEMDRADGSSTARAVWLDASVMYPNIELPASWSAAIRAALGAG